MKYILIILLSLFLVPFSANAKSNGKLAKYFQEQIEILNQSVIESDSNSNMTDKNSNQMWFLYQFMLRLRAPIGFDIEGFLTFQVIPETEFVWLRGFPEGWAPYKP